MENFKFVFLVLLLVVTSCSSTPDMAKSLVSVCPKYPDAGPKVAEELKRIPFRGFKELEELRIHMDQRCAVGKTKDACYAVGQLNAINEEMIFPEGFEDLWNRENNLRDLKLQLELCRDS